MTDSVQYLSVLLGSRPSMTNTMLRQTPTAALSEYSRGGLFGGRMYALHKDACASTVHRRAEPVKADRHTNHVIHDANKQALAGIFELVQFISFVSLSTISSHSQNPTT